MNKLAVMLFDQIQFVGTREECYNWMQEHEENWDDLRYIKGEYPNPKDPRKFLYELGRCSSYVF
jgi:hypothetical protein